MLVLLSYNVPLYFIFSTAIKEGLTLGNIVGINTGEDYTFTDLFETK